MLKGARSRRSSASTWRGSWRACRRRASATRPRSTNPARDDSSSGARKRLDAALGQVEPEFDLVEHRQGLAPLLAALPARERRILLLRFFGNMTQSQIAAQVGLSQMHVSRILSRTLATVRRKLTTPQPW